LIYSLHVSARKQGAALLMAAITILAGSIGSRHALAQADDIRPLLGTWVFVPEQSTMDPVLIPFRRGTCIIQPWEGGVRITYDMVRLRGGITHLEWTGAIDGKDYAVQGVDSDVTNAYRRLDDRTYEIVQKVNGAVSLVERLTISADGKVITTTAPLKDASGRTATLKTVYRKQSDS
jgi:hypothetical protein